MSKSFIKFTKLENGDYEMHLHWSLPIVGLVVVAVAVAVGFFWPL